MIGLGTRSYTSTSVARCSRPPSRIQWKSMSEIFPVPDPEWYRYPYGRILNPRARRNRFETVHKAPGYWLAESNESVNECAEKPSITGSQSPCVSRGAKSRVYSMSQHASGGFPHSPSSVMRRQHTGRSLLDRTPCLLDVHQLRPSRADSQPEGVHKGASEQARFRSQDPRGSPTEIHAASSIRNTPGSTALSRQCTWWSVLTANMMYCPT